MKMNFCIVFACVAVGLNCHKEVCSKLSKRDSPSSVHDLRPDDIQVVVAIGDSITAGFGLKYRQKSLSDFTQILRENRGSSFSIGGDEGQVTLPNFLKEFNPALYGQSLGDPLPSYCSAKFCPPSFFIYPPEGDSLNAAISGASFTNLPIEVEFLRKKLVEKNLKDKWKLLTLFIGGNDICKESCRAGSQLKDPDYFQYFLLEALIKLREFAPKTIVNILLLPDVTQILEVSMNSRKCRLAKHLAKLDCPCAFNSEESRRQAKETQLKFNKVIQKVASYFQKQVNAEFAVRVTPMLSETQIPDDSYLSDVDCFHGSLKASRAAAISLWNSLFLPMDKRPLEIDFEATAVCPKDEDRIQIE